MKIIILSTITFLFAIGMKGFFKDDLNGKSLMLLILLISSYYSWLYIENKRVGYFAKSLLLGLGAAALFVLYLNTWEAANSVSQWDFVGFYFEGKLGIYNLPFYDPESFKIIFKDLNTVDIFRQDLKAEVLNIGMLYPPITMLFLAPLAFFDPTISRFILSYSITIAIILSSYLLYIFAGQKNKSAYTFILIFIYVVFLPGTRSTLMYNQLNYFLLIFLILMLQNYSKPNAGIYHAFTILFKPITIFLIIGAFILKKWKNILYFCLTGLVLVMLTGFLWGFQNFVDYFLNSPIKNLPDKIYEQIINQSLLAAITRNLKIYGLSKTTIQILYYICSAIILVFTIWSSRNLTKISKEITLFPFIIFMLIVYPHSLTHYMVLMLPVIIWFLLNSRFEEHFWLMIIPAAAFMHTKVFYSYIIILAFLIYYAFWGHEKRLLKSR